MAGAMGLVLLLGGIVTAGHKTLAQESEADAGKRKIRVRVTPVYPPLARQMNVSGRVKIEVTVAPDGRVVSSRVVGGSPLLVNSALDAVKKFQFEPGSRETIETLEFQFDR